MKHTGEEVRMKKAMTAAFLLAILVGMGLSREAREERQYANICFTVWQMKDGASEAARRIGTPIPEVFRESWTSDIFSLDVTEGKPAARIVEKDHYRFVLTAEPDNRLAIQVFEKDKEIFRFVHTRPSSADYIFTGTDGLTYLMEVTYSSGNHRIGLVSPGILKK